MRRAHARRLLLTLAGICLELHAKQENPAARAAYREVENQLRRLALRRKT